MSQENLDGIEQKYQQVKAFIEALAQINKSFNAEQGITEAYLGPFNKGYELQALVAKVRDDLLNFVVNKLNAEYCPNVPINLHLLKEELNKKYNELGFNLGFITEHIRLRYVARRETLSREEITSQARQLLPTLWGPSGRREPKLEDIQQGRKLVLRLYMESIYSDKFKRLAAIEKLIKIALDGADPAIVTDSNLSTAYWKNEPYITREVQDPNIEKTRAHKNGKFLIYFKDEDKARKVAEALLKGEQEG